ncbi:MAG: response regulator, partial [Acetobacteraceae bacterium]|nr:response regulator [Acetobacteraceae bacterium]
MTAEVLVLDDEAAISELLVRTLAQRGIAASSAPDADAAERRLAEDPDLLVLVSDVRMPGTDGATLAARLLAKRAEDAALEIVLMTGDALEADLPHDSVFAVVQKPFRLGEVHGVLRRALDAARQRRMAARLEAEAASAVDERAIRFAGLTRDDARAREMLRLVAEALRPGLSAALGTDGLPAPALRAVMELAGAVSLAAGPDDLRREVTTGAAVAAAAATLA